MAAMRSLFWAGLVAVASLTILAPAAAEPRAMAAAEMAPSTPGAMQSAASANAGAAATGETTTTAAVAQHVVQQAAKPPAAPKPAITLHAKVDLARQTLTVIDHGATVGIWKISSGTAEHPTPRGVYQPEWTAKMWFSRKYDDAPMPHAVFFKNGAAIHATGAIGALGRPASHGCVRLAPAHAETFYRLVLRHGLANTRIAVYGNPPYQGQPVAARTNRSSRNLANVAPMPGNRAPTQSIRYASASVFAPHYYAPIPISAVRSR